MYRLLGKRIADLVLVVPALLLLLPVYIFLALLVHWRLGTPILFRQQRPGLHGKPFTLYKFRTMTNRCNDQGILLTDADRLTPFGNWLRSSSLDELPELWNILKGEMSFVGPRPLLLSYLARYTPEQMCRHNVLPGLTGWAQVHGRNALSWDEKFKLDLWYVDHLSFTLDLKIIFLTIWKTVLREGIHASGAATMPEFMGTPPPSSPQANSK